MSAGPLIRFRIPLNEKTNLIIAGSVQIALNALGTIIQAPIEVGINLPWGGSEKPTHKTQGNEP